MPNKFVEKFYGRSLLCCKDDLPMNIFLKIAVSTEASLLMSFEVSFHHLLLVAKDLLQRVAHSQNIL